MQKLYIASKLPLGPKEAWDVFESDTFRDRLAEQTGLTSEILERHEEGSVEVRRLKYVSGSDLPKIAAKALGTKRLAYEQVNRFDKANNSMQWKVHLPVLSDRVRVEGTTTITADGEGSNRIVDGEIEVKMRLIGGQIEKAVVAEFEKSMRRAVDLAREMMES